MNNIAGLIKYLNSWNVLYAHMTEENIKIQAEPVKEWKRISAYRF